MPLFNLVVFLNPKEGRDEEFNEWYDTHHVPDALSMKGMKLGQRFKVGPRYMDRDAPCRYMAFYEIEADSMDEALAIFSEGTGRFFVDDSVDLKSAHAFPLEPLSARFTSSGEARSAGLARHHRPITA